MTIPLRRNLAFKRSASESEVPASGPGSPASISSGHGSAACAASPDRNRSSRQADAWMDAVALNWGSGFVMLVGNARNRLRPDGPAAAGARRPTDMTTPGPRPGRQGDRLVAEGGFEPPTKGL